MGELEAVQTDGSGHNHTAEDLETIVVDPDDIISAFERNRRDENEQRSHVLRVTPPLEGEQAATLHVSDDHAYYPPEIDPKPLHLGQEQFVGEDSTRLSDRFKAPEFSPERALFRDEYDDDFEWTDEMEAEFDEWWDVATEVWEEHVRANLRDEIMLQERTADGWVETTVDVRYEDDE